MAIQIILLRKKKTFLRLDVLPFLIFYPILELCMVYFVIGLNNNTTTKFPIAMAIGVLTWFAGSAFGLCISTFVPKIGHARRRGRKILK